MLPGQMNSKQVLLVDDDAVSRRHARAILAGAGYGVSEAGSVHAALKMSEVDAPHLVVLDLVLPTADGFEFLDQRRMNPKLARIPVIVLSGAPGREAVYRAMAEGASDYLAKPIEANLLLQKARKHLREREFLAVDFGSNGPAVTAALPAIVVSANTSQCAVSAAARLAYVSEDAGGVRLRDWDLAAAIGASPDQLKRSRKPSRNIGPSRYVSGFDLVGLNREQAEKLGGLIRRGK